MDLSLFSRLRLEIINVHNASYKYDIGGEPLWERFYPKTK